MRKAYTLEFKQQAVELAKSLGGTEAGHQLGVAEGNIRRWKRDFEQGQSSPGSLKITPVEAEELKQLRKENEQLKKVNYILKRAAAFFSQDHLK